MEKYERYNPIFKESNKEKNEEDAPKESIVENIDIENFDWKGDEYYDRMYDDAYLMSDIEIYAENDSTLYNQFKSIIKNIGRKIKSDKYDHKLAPKLWMHYVVNAIKGYTKAAGEKFDISKKDKEVLAQKIADWVIYNWEANSQI